METLPQIQTVIQEFGPPISTIIDAPWVSVTSVNGMTGDVIVELVLSNFQPNHLYTENTAIIYQGSLYYAKETFTSSSTFNSNDWTAPQFSQEQANWSETNTSSNAYIKNKPTKLSDFSNDQNFVTETTLNTELEEIDTTISSISGAIGDIGSTVTSLSSSLTETDNKIDSLATSTTTSLANKVDKETGKGLSSNNFTDAYKDMLDALQNTILDRTYPVGSIFMSATLSTVAAVQNALGGTWEVFGQGRTIVGINPSDSDFNAPLKTGGVKTVTLTQQQIPSHNHGIYAYNFTATGFQTGGGEYRYAAIDSQHDYLYPDDISNTGGGLAHNNLQPYITTYIYRRTA